MKLIFCPKCHDIVKLLFTTRSCSCGKSSGKYLDKLNARIAGEAIPIGFDNFTLKVALKHGGNFDAFVIDIQQCKTIKKLKRIKC